jgi:hypothetical protein
MHCCHCDLPVEIKKRAWSVGDLSDGIRQSTIGGPTLDEARRIASNIAKLPTLLGKP